MHNCLVLEEADENFQSVQIAINVREKEEPRNHLPTPLLWEQNISLSHYSFLLNSAKAQHHNSILLISELSEKITPEKTVYIFHRFPKEVFNVFREDIKRYFKYWKIFNFLLCPTYYYTV